MSDNKIEEIERLRAENERLQNEDTKTRHALKGWVYVCPDGGAEPTHERVAAVVAEVERLRAEVDGLEAELAMTRPVFCEMVLREKVRTLEAEVERLRTGLRWYADPRNHFPVERRSPGDPDPAVVFVDEPAIMTDCGRRAREALEAKP